MLVRMRKDVRGSFCGIPAAGGDCVSVYRGALVDVPEVFGLRLLMNGTAQEGGGDLGKDGQIPPPKELAKIRARIAELTPQDPIDQLRDKKMDPAERAELLHRAFNM
ncbi:hypothetical protein [Mycobacterium sp.]|uniref:hypothetical protein n=1 Tax=Mycobacterium sp. TaxID=1785 RepID=UPI003F99ADAD